MRRSITVLLTLVVGLSGPSVVAQVGAKPETLAGIHRNEGVRGRAGTVVRRLPVQIPVPNAWKE